jgi:hypothetical protein
MKLKRTFLGLLLFFSFSCSFAAAISQGQADNGFQLFWSAFRQAALAGDKDKLEAMTKLPILVKGTVDEDAVKHYDIKLLLGNFDRLLSQDTGQKPEPETMKSLIEKTQVIAAGQTRISIHEVRIGTFVFQKIQNRWLFSIAYIEE